MLSVITLNVSRLKGRNWQNGLKKYTIQLYAAYRRQTSDSKHQYVESKRTAKYVPCKLAKESWSGYTIIRQNRF